MEPHIYKANNPSIHEAGHAVIALALRHRVDIVTIRGGRIQTPTGDRTIGGGVHMPRRSHKIFRERPDGSFVNTIAEKEQRAARESICICLAGREAEQQIAPDRVIPDSDMYDREDIVQLLPLALGRWQSEADALSRLSTRTQSLVHTYREVILLLASWLLSEETLSGRETRLACDGPMRIARRRVNPV
jgi:hypothetical protein